MNIQIPRWIRYLAAASLVFMLGLAPLAATVSNGSVTPGTISFNSSNPDGTSTGSPSTTTVSFKTTAGPASFTVYAKAAGPDFTCANGNTPPVSSVTLSCSNASSITCQSGGLTLTNTGNGIQVAHGSGSHNSVSFNVSYTFQDNWKYNVGSTCTLSVSYLYTEP